MVGEGIKRDLFSKDVSLLQIEKNADTIAALYKKQDKYIKVKWQIINSLPNEVQGVIDTDILIKEEGNGNILFQSAEYITHLSSSLTKIKSNEYYEKEYNIHCDITITDDFLIKQTKIGTNILKFERYLNEH